MNPTVTQFRFWEDGARYLLRYKGKGLWWLYLLNGKLRQLITTFTVTEAPQGEVEVNSTYERAVMCIPMISFAYKPTPKPKGPPKYVIRFSDGAYNRGQGFDATLDEATRYDTWEEAQVQAATLETCTVIEDPLGL